MQEKIKYLQAEIEQLKKDKEDIKTNPKAIEKYAREKYFMKKPNEDVFVIESLKK